MSYVPSRADIVSLNFDPEAGHEQAGRRPALILSPEKYDEKAELALVCPITKERKDYPCEVELPDESCHTYGVLLSDHVKNLDWKQSNTKFIEKSPKAVVLQVQKNIQKLLTE